jgi:hypothetical protein
MSETTFSPELTAKFSITANGVTKTFLHNLDFCVTQHAGEAPVQRWFTRGKQQLVALGLASAPGAAVQINPPTVAQARAMAIGASVAAPAAPPAPAPPKAATPVAPMPRAAAEAIVAAANAKMAAAKPAPAAALTPEQVAASVNGAKADAGHGWDEVIAKINAERR